MRIFILTFICFLIAVPYSAAAEKYLDIKEIKTNSGITVWLVEDHSLPIISMDFSFKGAGSIRNTSKKQGTARLLSNMLDEGAGELKSQEFQKQLSDHSISLSFGSGRDNFGGSLKTLTRHKEKAFELLKLTLTKPRFDQEPLNRMRDANIARIRNSMGKPDWIKARIFNDKAFENHPYALNSGGTITSLNKITADDLQNHMKEWLTLDHLHIGIMGDITAQEVTQMVEDVFSGLPRTREKKPVEKIEIQNQKTAFLYEKDIPQTMITIAMPAFDNLDPDYYALQIMNYIYGGSGFGSRLMAEAREKRGLTYGIYSSHSHQDYIDYLSIGTSTKRQSTSEMLDIIYTEMDKIKQTPVETQTLQDAKSYLTGSIPLSLTSTDRISSMLLSLQMNERPADYLDTYSDKINAVTAEDVQKVAKRVLDKNKAIVVMVGKPENIVNLEIVETVPNVE